MSKKKNQTNTYSKRKKKLKQKKNLKIKHFLIRFFYLNKKIKINTKEIILKLNSSMTGIKPKIKDFIIEYTSETLKITKKDTKLIKCLISPSLTINSSQIFKQVIRIINCILKQNFWMLKILLYTESYMINLKLKAKENANIPLNSSVLIKKIIESVEISELKRLPLKDSNLI